MMGKWAKSEPIFQPSKGASRKELSRWASQALREVRGLEGGKA